MRRISAIVERVADNAAALQRVQQSMRLRPRVPESGAFDRRSPSGSSLSTLEIYRSSVSGKASASTSSIPA